ncbi:MAG: FAD-linked oxidase C-terminal domain-containing protein [Candidatus Helarchaeota archaeon]
MQPYNELTKDLLQKFRKIVGMDHSIIEKELRWPYAFGGTMIEPDWVPDLVLMPQNREQIAEILKLANKNKIPVTARGSGTSLSAGPLTPYGGIVLDLSLMNKILSIDIDNFMVEVEPGVICDDLNEKLRSYGFFFPPDPGSSSVATIGGMVATNAGGLQAFKYGVTKNYVLYLEVVLPTGKIMNLGTKTLKSVSSYNIKDLVIGSEGTLGVITKIGLKISPLPKYRRLGFFIFEDVEDLTEAVLELRRNGIIPNLLEFMDKRTVKAVFEYLKDEFSEYPIGYTLLAEIDGRNENAVEDDFSNLFKIFQKHKPILYRIAKNTEEREKFIIARKAVLPALSTIGPNTSAEDCTIQITNFIEAIKRFEALPQKLQITNIEMIMVCHMEGNLHPVFIFNENDPKARKNFQRALDYLYKEIIIPLGGTITGEHGIGKIKTPYLELEHGPDVVELMCQLKQLFDPNKILNPGVGKGDLRPLPKSDSIRQLKNQPGKILIFNCMRCGFCSVICPSKAFYKSEAYSPRGRLSILNGLIYGELNLNEHRLIQKILYACTLCGHCRIKCPSGVETNDIFEKARERLFQISTSQ